MDKMVAEWNAKMVYYLIFALIAVFIVYLWYRHLRSRRKKSCAYCGRNLFKQSVFKDSVKGMPKTFCNRECANHFRESGPMPPDQQQIHRADELLRN